MYDVAKRMVEMTPALLKRSKVMAATKRLVNYSNAGFYQVLSAEVGTKHGLNVSGLVLDELHTVGEKYRQEIEKNARIAQNQDEYKKREAELAEEYNRVDAEAKAVEAEIQKRQSCGRRIEGLIAALEEAREDFTESLWGSMVEKVTVFEDGLVFMLTSGEEVKVAPC